MACNIEEACTFRLSAAAEDSSTKAAFCQYGTAATILADVSLGDTTYGTADGGVAKISACADTSRMCSRATCTP